jgi:hypothetical protein
MQMRDRARSDLYLAQLRAQSAPNTPGFPLTPGILSPRDGGWMPPQGYDHYNTDKRSQKAVEAGFDIEDGGVQYATVPARKPSQPTLFTLQAPPLAKKRHGGTGSIDSTPTSPMSHTTSPLAMTLEERRRSHVPAAPGEVQYGEVAIPGSYAPTTPGVPPPLITASHGFNFNAPPQ